MDQQRIEELKNEHGDVYVLDADGHEIVVRMPKPSEWDRFATVAMEDKKAPKALAQLVRDCLVHPSREEYAEMIGRRPGLVNAYGKELSRIAGASVDVDVKKA